MEFERLLFRRQFLLTSEKCGTLENWQYQTLGKFHIYAHPDVNLNLVVKDHEKPGVACIGYMIDPNHPDRTDVEILADIQNSVQSISEICQYLYFLSGRFVLIFKFSEDIYIFNDACGLRSVFYTRENGKTLVGSQPLIFEQVTPLRRGENFASYNRSDYKKSHIEHWIPGGYSLFEDVFQLLPNRYLKISTLEQVRFWPDKPIKNEPLEKVSRQAAELLEAIMIASYKRFPLAVSLTAGFDTRTVLSACKSIAPDIYFYTLKIRDLTEKSPDIAVPAALMKALGFTHHIINCLGDIDPDFARVYELNTPMAHLNDWGRSAYGRLTGELPVERVAVTGVCSEISRCGYYPEGTHQTYDTPEKFSQFVRSVTEWEGLPFLYEQMVDWYNEIYPISKANRVDILDLFLWEQREGGWQAQSQLESDTVQEVFSPLNNRGLMEIMLRAPIKYRCAPEYVLNREIWKILWPEISQVAINPPHSKKEWLRQTMYRIGIGESARRIYRVFTGKPI